jgi:GxxExxY protein
MDTDKHGSNPAAGEQTPAVIGAACEVLNGLGHGRQEEPQENALMVELGPREIPSEQQRRFAIRSEEALVGEFIPDLVVGATRVVDTKVIERVTNLERGRRLNYRRLTKLRVGRVVNFKRPKLEWERIVC